MEHLYCSCDVQGDGGERVGAGAGRPPGQQEEAGQGDQEHGGTPRRIQK